MPRSSDEERRRRHRNAPSQRHDSRRTRNEDPPLIQEMAGYLNDDDVLGLLAQVSGLLHVLDPGRDHILTRSQTPTGNAAVDRGQFVRSLIDIDLRETTAILTAWQHLAADELESRLITNELRRRHHPLPGWLTTLGQARVARVATMRDAFGDVDQYLVELHWGPGVVLTLVAMMDANLGYALADGFALPVPIDEVQRIAAGSPEPITFEDVDPAQARARIEQGVEHSAMIVPPIETESWPLASPLLEWAVRLLPTGGSGRDFSSDGDAVEPARIAADFAASRHARGLDRHLATSIAESLCWFAEFNCGDPLRWSPVKVEQVLEDWWPRKVVAPSEEQDAVPDVLAAFVRYCGATKGLGRAQVSEIVRAIEDSRPVYQQLLASPGRDPATMLARLAAGLPLDGDDGSFEPSDWDQLDMLEVLADRVGGRETLDELTTDPLPDEAFSWEGLPDDIRPRVELVLAELDPRAERLFDVEFRTACRRLLTHVALTHPEIFRRRGSEVTAACAIAYLVADANDFIGARGVYAKTLAERFGLTAMPTSRADTFRRAARDGGWTNALGGVCNPDLLTSQGRRKLIESRDWWRDRA